MPTIKKSMYIKPFVILNSVRIEQSGSLIPIKIVIFFQK